MDLEVWRYTLQNAEGLSVPVQSGHPKQTLWLRPGSPILSLLLIGLDLPYSNKDREAGVQTLSERAAVMSIQSQNIKTSCKKVQAVIFYILQSVFFELCYEIRLLVPLVSTQEGRKGRKEGPEGRWLHQPQIITIT